MRDELDQPVELACPDCGYNVAIIPSGRCPECGGAFDRTALRRAQQADQPRLWQPLTLIFTIPVAASALFVLAAFAMEGAILWIAPVLAVIVITGCAIGTIAAADSLTALLRQRGIGMGLTRRRFTAVLIFAAIVLQVAALALGVVIAYALTGPWHAPFQRASDDTGERAGSAGIAPIASAA